MNPREEGFLLLTSRLGDPKRDVLTTAQLHTLWQRVRLIDRPKEDRELEEQDLLALGYGQAFARRVLALLEETELLRSYIARGKLQDCVPLTLAGSDYPMLLRQRLGMDCPGSLWAKGSLDILKYPAISLVGSRELLKPNRSFAAEVGRQAARQGLTLISGNARGADREAQESCLSAGGRVISIVADELKKQPLRRSVLYVSEDGFDEPFSAQRALSRNRCIHAMGRIVFVAQSNWGKGGSWDGTVKNLRHGWSPVACFRDGSKASRELEQMGAYLVGMNDLTDFHGLSQAQQNLWETFSEKQLPF